MTNEEKANEIVKCIIHDRGCVDVVTDQAARTAALTMAQWKDEQFAKEKQALIDKACEWWENELIYPSMPHSVIDIILGRIKEFKQAMKGGKE